MKISTKIRVNIFLFIAFAMVMLCVFMVMTARVDESLQNDLLVNRIVSGVNDLNTATYDFVLRPDERPRSQWELKHASLEKLIKTVRTSENSLLEQIARNHNLAKTAFEKLVHKSDVADYKKSGPYMYYQEDTQRLVAQLLARTRMISTDAALLTQESTASILSLNRKSFQIAVGIVLLMTGVVTSASFLLKRKVTRSLRDLYKGTEIIAAGNLAHRVRMSGNDEIGELSRAFDLMASKLESTTISRDAFSKEVQERKVAEESLRESEQKYRELVQNANSAIIRWQRGGAITFFNEYAQKFFGYYEDEIIGRPVSILVPETESLGKDLSGLVEKIVNHPDQFARNINENIRRDGSRVWMAWTNRPVFDRNGEVVEILAVGTDITERKLAEEEIRRQQAILEAINRIFREALTFETEEELGLTCLRAAEELTHSEFGFIGIIGKDGLLHDVAMSDPGWELCTMYDRSGHHRPPGDFELHGIYGRVLMDGRSFFTNDPLSHPDSIGTPDGHPPLTSFLGAPLSQNGSTIGMVALGNRKDGYTKVEQQALDAIAPAIVHAFLRKKAEKTLQESEATLRAILDATNESIWLFSPDGIVLEANDTALSRVGRTAGELFGKHFNSGNLMPAETAASRQACLRKVAETARAVELEDVRAGMNFQHSFYPVADVEGHVRSIVVFSRDVTRRKQAEEELRKSEAKFRSIFETNVVPIAYCHVDGRILDANDAYLRLIGYSREELRDGKVRWDVVTPPEWKQLDETELELLVKTGTSRSAEKEYLRRDGTRVPVLIGASRLQNPEHVVAFAIDLTERKQMEEKLREARDELELRVQERTAELRTTLLRLQESNQALQDFASIASHDMKEPLRKVIAFGNLLQERFGDSMGDTGKDYLGRMLNATERMQALLISLLDYSRVTSRAEPLERVDLSTLVEEVLSDLEVSIERAGGKVNVGELPVIKADPTQMRQLFQNLISNALKFHKENETPVITVSCIQTSDMDYKIVVIDNGIGFDEEHLDKIFAPFQRIHGRSSQYEGTGMGLAICKKIVERHGGTISAKSSPGQGATFIVQLPIKQRITEDLEFL